MEWSAHLTFRTYPLPALAGRAAGRERGSDNGAFTPAMFKKSEIRINFILILNLLLRDLTQEIKIKVTMKKHQKIHG
jgi:hypothetical protein